jgi:hypothetical protein
MIGGAFDGFNARGIFFAGSRNDFIVIGFTSKAGTS